MASKTVPQQHQVRVSPVTPGIGAYLLGVDAAKVISAEVGLIRDALLKNKVIFIRDQHIDSDDFLKFAEQFGPTTLHHPVSPTTEVSDAASLKAKAAVWERDNSYRSDHWHTDATFIDRPPSITILRCMKTPEVGGDTLFANTVAAYERLPEPLKVLADSLRAIHTLRKGMRRMGRWTDPDSGDFVTEHPVVRIHGETGERSLLLGSVVDQIVGLSPEASAGLFKIFQDYIQMPENIVRWHWNEGDIAMWDNRSTQHYAANDYGDAPRLMQRLTIAGGIPVGVDGRPSRALVGDASSFSPIGRA